MLDLYCERTAPGFWNEPLNTVSNLAFLLAAGVVATAFLRHRNAMAERGADLWLLILWLATIGIGSGLWHLTARRWAWWLDVVPIQLFMLTFLQSFMRRALGWGMPRVGLALAGFVVLNVTVEITIGDALNRSVAYLPAYALLLAMTAWMYRRNLAMAPLFGLAAGVFLPSLVLRTVDGVVCEALPGGTHFLWHLLNAVVLGSLLLAMIRLALSRSAAR